MKTNVLVAALTAASLTFSGLALAQGRDGRDGRDDRPGQSQRGDNRGGPGYDRGGPGPDRGGPRGYEGGPRNGPPPFSHAGGRGAGPDHNFYRGGRLPTQYRSRGYVVDDWRGHRLSAPPRGYHWVQTGGDYVLIAIATGIIAQILLSQ